jgi:microsomal dipeptidase-like Zn-dependent dipeptidase
MAVAPLPGSAPRCQGLTHDVRNEIGDGVRERSAGGLTHFGVNVEECTDSASSSTCRTYQTGDRRCPAVGSQPIIASHPTPGALSSSPQLDRRIDTRDRQGGGVIGFHALDAASARPDPTPEDLLHHISTLPRSAVLIHRYRPDLMKMGCFHVLPRPPSGVRW